MMKLMRSKNRVVPPVQAKCHIPTAQIDLPFCSTSGLLAALNDENDPTTAGPEVCQPALDQFYYHAYMGRPPAVNRDGVDQ